MIIHYQTQDEDKLDNFELDYYGDFADQQPEDIDKDMIIEGLKVAFVCLDGLTKDAKHENIKLYDLENYIHNIKFASLEVERIPENDIAQKDGSYLLYFIVGSETAGYRNLWLENSFRF
jgi:hypothetical protein